jgi:hypothetical protein
MIGIGLQPTSGFPRDRVVHLPTDLGWDQSRFPLTLERAGINYRVTAQPRALVSAAIWTGPAFHVDGVAGADTNSGLGEMDGDFATAKRTIFSAFVAGNATGAPYRVIVKPGQYSESAFTRNGNDEPAQPVAIIGWNGEVRYRTGPFSVPWTASSGTFTAPVTSLNRAFRTDILTEQGLYQELIRVADTAACAGTVNSWVPVGSLVHVNIGKVPGAQDIALIRSFHGARFLTHASDLYLENIHCEGGITGALHCDAIANRNIVGVNSTFRYSSPSSAAAPLDSARVRRTNGLCAFFGCDASGGAKDGWTFHEDGTQGMHVLLQDCTGVANGWGVATSCNGFTTHDEIKAIVLGGLFGWSRNGTEVHCIQSTRTFMAGTRSVARDIDGTSVAYKCSNLGQMWLQDTIADAAGAESNFAIEANGGAVFIRDHQNIAGTVSVSSGGSVSPF